MVHLRGLFCTIKFAQHLYYHFLSYLTIAILGSRAVSCALRTHRFPSIQCRSIDPYEKRQCSHRRRTLGPYHRFQHSLSYSLTYSNFHQHHG
ncbi:hypothetical protein BCR34DRAFT_274815 [Clohesyomyces aquaticus]|uniref:Uncharacterized protein n=1 Tax=Clohesyomyces aquaticus TaxID=1231657 RepID=A0A1Y1ZS99_9PLEO|nr:hypothetical protein BCR34DRAFT_274815 [Clohesyomyces aquaticus]